MRHGARQNAISNSPFVRALLKPVHVDLPLPLAAATTNKKTAAPTQSSPPPPSHLISTQPLPYTSTSTSTSTSNGAAVGAKRKREDADEGDERDAVVEVNYHARNLPQELRKYWAQRYRLFSLFDEGCQMDLEGWYSVTPEYVAAQIAERCRSSVIVDAFCGVGGNAIQFAFTCEKVIAIDNSPVRLACAKHNAEIYGVADRITFILGDFVTWSKDYVARKAAGSIDPSDEVEVVFLSPPWGGIDYREAPSTTTTSTNDSPAAKRLKGTASPLVPSTPTPSLHSSRPSYPLSALAPLPGEQLFALARAMTPHVAYYLPRNMDMEEVARLPEVAPRSDKNVGEVERVEVEEEWMDGKMKAVTCYYGDLARQK